MVFVCCKAEVGTYSLIKVCFVFFYFICILHLLYYFVKGKIKMLVFLLISGLSGESTFGKLAGIGMVGRRKKNNP